MSEQFKPHKRGKKELTPQGKKEAQNWQKTRMKIANLVARKPEIKKKCCICNTTAEVEILHNKVNPYNIAFICKSCRKWEKNVNKAEEQRMDIRELLDKTYLNVRNFTESEVVSIVDGYLTTILTIGDYCASKNISRHQFTKLMERYNKIKQTEVDRELANYNMKREKINQKIEKAKQENKPINKKLKPLPEKTPVVLEDIKKKVERHSNRIQQNVVRNIKESETIMAE